MWRRVWHRVSEMGYDRHEDLRMTHHRRALLAAWLVALFAAPCAADVAFLAAPLEGGHQTQSVSINNGPYINRPDAKLIVRDDAGNERVLINPGALDFTVCHDGKTILASVIAGGQADIFRVDIATGASVRLTNGPGCNCQPVETGDGIAFLSNRDAWQSPKAGYPAFTIYRMDRDGKNLQRVWHAGLGGVFGLFCGPDGRLYFTSGENQGLKPKAGMNWVVWSINPDGSEFKPEISGFGRKPDFTPPSDWPVITSDGTLVWSVYYNTRVYGSLHAAPKFVPTPAGPPTQFGHPLWTKNPGFPNGYDEHGGGDNVARFGLARRGEYAPAPWSTDADYENRNPKGETPGMLSHPYPTRHNGIFCTWTGDRGDKQINLGVYSIPNIAKPAETYHDLVKIVDEPDRHEWMGKEVASFAEIYGSDGPPTPTGAIAAQLPEGSPFGVIGTSGVDIHEWVQGNEEDSEVKLIEMPEDSAEYVRILSFNPTLAVRMADELKNGPPWNERLFNHEGFYSEVNERMGFYVPDIPLKKWRTTDGRLYVGPHPPAGATRIKRSDGRPDYSFRAEVPANQPWSLQLLDAQKRVIYGSTAQTWHQVVSRERRTDCQGCHAHWQPDKVPFDETVAASQEYPTYRLQTIRTVVYERDIAPLNLGIEQRPWDHDGDGKVAHRSFGSSLVQDKPWTPEQIELVSAWQGTGMLAAGTRQGRLIKPDSLVGPYADTTDPTLVVRVLPDRTVIGAFDPQAGIDPESLTIALDRKSIAAEFTENPAEHIWTRPGALAGQVLLVSVQDMHGNTTTIERALRNETTTAPSIAVRGAAKVHAEMARTPRAAP